MVGVTCLSRFIAVLAINTHSDFVLIIRLRNNFDRRYPRQRGTNCLLNYVLLLQTIYICLKPFPKIKPHTVPQAEWIHQCANGHDNFSYSGKFRLTKSAQTLSIKQLTIDLHHTKIR